MYRHVLKQDITGLKYKNTRVPKNLPPVLSSQEVAQIMIYLHREYWLLVALLYGCGLRIQEALTLGLRTLISH